MIGCVAYQNGENRKVRTGKSQKKIEKKTQEKKILKLLKRYVTFSICLGLPSVGIQLKDFLSCGAEIKKIEFFKAEQKVKHLLGPLD